MENIDLNIKKDSRGSGKYHHKMPRGLGATRVKQIALRDISKECGMNYIEIESKVLNSSGYDFEYVQIENLNI